jgi:glucokinase
MALLGIDLGGNTLAAAVFTDDGSMLHKTSAYLEGRAGAAVGRLVIEHIRRFVYPAGQVVAEEIRAIGISVPGIYHQKTGTVWAPNIPGWENYPLLEEVKSVTGGIPVTMDSDRACYILGEHWQGHARGCRDAIFLSVGTGIGAGILINGNILRGAHDIAGAAGWLGLNRPFTNGYISCGCFEYHASGDGIARVARDLLKDTRGYEGILKQKPAHDITAHDVFRALDQKDPIAAEVIRECIAYWGMAVANLISLFNPEKIILGGGVFGPAIRFIPDIQKEAEKWAQPISVHQCTLEASALNGDAGVYGTGYLAWKSLNPAKTAY